VSKYTHNERLIGAFTSSGEVVVDNITNSILGDTSDEERCDPNPR